MPPPALCQGGCKLPPLPPTSGAPVRPGGHNVDVIVAPLDLGPRQTINGGRMHAYGRVRAYRVPNWQTRAIIACTNAERNVKAELECALLCSALL